MNSRKMLLSVMFCLVAASVCFASDPNLGSWKLNEAKSKIAAGAPKNTSVVYTMAGEKYKCVVDGVDAKGNALHNEWTGSFDGKDYPIVGDPSADTRAIKMTSPGHYELTNKKAGKTTVVGTIVTSADGKTRTLTTKNAGGKSSNTFVYDKQ